MSGKSGNQILNYFLRHPKSSKVSTKMRFLNGSFMKHFKTQNPLFFFWKCQRFKVRLELDESDYIYFFNSK